MIIVMMGVTGAGKTTVGTALARVLECGFIEGDDLHGEHNRRKMAAGVPLDDADRWPWLDALGERLAGCGARNESAVAACSALKRAYRDRLRARCPQVRFVHLQSGEECIAARLAGRTGHYMPASLLPSQLATLEAPVAAEEGVLIVSAERPVEAIVGELARLLARDARPDVRIETEIPGR